MKYLISIRNSIPNILYNQNPVKMYNHLNNLKPDDHTEDNPKKILIEENKT